MEFAIQCCVCLALKSITGEWFPHNEKIFTLSHGYCPTCIQIERHKLEELKRTKEGTQR